LSTASLDYKAIAGRQQHWAQVLRSVRRGSPRQVIAERARARYGAILAEIELAQEI